MKKHQQNKILRQAQQLFENGYYFDVEVTPSNDPVEIFPFRFFKMNRKRTTHTERSQKNKKNAVRRRRRRRRDHEVPTQVWTACVESSDVMSFDHRFLCAFFPFTGFNVFTCPWLLHLFPMIQRGSLCFKRKPHSPSGGHFYCFPHGTTLKLDVSSAQKRWDGSEARSRREMILNSRKQGLRKGKRSVFCTWPSFAFAIHVAHWAVQWTPRAAQIHSTHMGQEPKQMRHTIHPTTQSTQRESPDGVTSRVPRYRSFALVKSKQKHTKTNKTKERERVSHTHGRTSARPIHQKTVIKTSQRSWRRRWKRRSNNNTKLKEKRRKPEKSQEERKREKKGRIIERTFPRGTV